MNPSAPNGEALALNTYRTISGRFLGPGFVVIALMLPGVLALGEPQSFTLQRALLTIGLGAGLASAALALYRFALPRRLLHLFLFSILLELFYRLAYHGPVSSGLLLSVGETSQRETIELLEGHAVLTCALSVVALLAVAALVEAWNTPGNFSWPKCAWAAGVSLLSVCGALLLGLGEAAADSQFEALVRSEVRGTFPFDIAAAITSVAAEMIDTSRAAPARAHFEFPNARALNASAEEEAQLYVIVVGETSRRSNWSLFGYARATTPRLAAIRDDLILVGHMNSNATTTILSVPLALTRAAPATRAVAHAEKSLISLLRQTGFETFWISNQERSGTLSNAISRIAFEADHTSFTQDLPPSARMGDFDSNLPARLNDALNGLKKGAKAAFFLHMEGSHFGYSERYPPPFKHFVGGPLPPPPHGLDGSQSRLVDEYDNSVLFTDHNVREVIDRLAACDCRAAMIFLSDHGERLFDRGVHDNTFGHGFPSVSRAEIDIPFFFWLSPKYQAANALPVEHLKANAGSVVQLHSLFETVVDLTGVTYDGRQANLSLFSDQLRTAQTLDVLNIEQEAVSLLP